jgi:hypothetical protein
MDMFDVAVDEDSHDPGFVSIYAGGSCILDE